ncbi:MAG TPA: diguanylate cyclase, partial [Herpetosiphonaceae bacterium]
MEQPASFRSTILIADDDVANLKLIVDHLRSDDLEILTARDGATALARAQLAQPDLIILDVQMPGIDGFEVCRRLKRSPATQAIPVIFMTALSGIEDKLRGFAAGGVDYVPKPFQSEELLARVSAHLTIFRLQRELRAEIAERRRAEAALLAANQELQRLAVLDELTSIANRRRFEQYLRAQWERPAPLSLVICDVDFFKRYNDAYGHPAGDRCLRQVAQAICRAASRVDDLVARYGGEEFAAILPDTGLQGALRVAQAIQLAVAELRIPHRDSAVCPHVTLSVGVAA